MTVSSCAFQSDAFQDDAFQVCIDEPEPIVETPRRFILGRAVTLYQKTFMDFEYKRKREDEEISIL
jgi:hypothetical protein